MTVRVDTTMDRRNDLGSFTVFTTSGETAYSAGIRLMQNPDVSNGFQDTRGMKNQVNVRITPSSPLRASAQP